MTNPSGFLDWDRLRVFLAVVHAGSFTRAARRLQLSQSAVSRQVCSLEESLKLSLFYRHARGLRLTEHGETFFTAVQGMDGLLAQVLAQIAETRAQAEGPLRITTTVAFGSAWLTSRIVRFHQLYPDIAISVLLVDSPELDLLSRQADVAIRFKEQTRGSLIQQRLMSIRYHLYASKPYLAAHGTPATVEDLDRHELIVYGGGEVSPWKNFDWILQAGREPGDDRQPALKVNNVYAMYRAVKSGLGIAALPSYIVEDGPDLQEVLVDTENPGFNAYLVYAEDMRGSKRVAALRDFLVQQVRLDAADLTGATNPAAPVCLRCRHVHLPEEACVIH